MYLIIHNEIQFKIWKIGLPAHNSNVDLITLMCIKYKTNIIHRQIRQFQRFVLYSSNCHASTNKKLRRNLSIVVPVKMMGKYREYFPAPNCSPSHSVFFKSLRIKASHNWQKSFLNSSSNSLYTAWSRRTAKWFQREGSEVGQSSTLPIFYVSIKVELEKNWSQINKCVPKEKPLGPSGETSILPGCGSPCM